MLAVSLIMSKEYKGYGEARVNDIARGGLRDDSEVGGRVFLPAEL